MITALDIQNIQSHEKTNLLFHPGVNVIVGSSDSGKTAILRSIRLAVWNRPSGTSLCSFWGGTSFVKLYIEEGSITRFKGKVDKYVLNIRGQEKQEFKAIGTSVPEEISRFLNISEINLQQQLDSPFLLSSTPGAVAQHFNKVARLDKIDTGLQNVQKAIRELTSDIKYAEQQEKSLEEGLEKFIHLEKFEIEIEVLEGMEKRVKSLHNRTDKLQELIFDITLVNTDIKDKSKILKFEEPLNQIFKWEDEIEDIGTEGSELQFLVKQIKDVRKEIKEQKQILTIETNVTFLLSLYKDKNKANESYKQLYKLSNSIEQVNISINIAEQKYKTLYSKFNKELIVCPLCGTKIR